MCLTIPAKVLELRSSRALIKEVSGARISINVSNIQGLRIGDWLLHISDLAIQKISKKDAMEIKDLLEPKFAIISPQKLSEKFQDIVKAAKVRELDKEEVVYLLKVQKEEKEALFSEANILRKTYLKDFICIHGIIEFSNYCQNDCLYCGLRKQNEKIKRYRMEISEIVAASEKAAKSGYKLLVLQSGHDPYYTDEILAEIIQKIKEKCRVFVFVSVGDRGYQCYKTMKKAGASGVLFRFETSNPQLFKKLHPRGKNFNSRFKHLEFMKKLGYFVATGSLMGLPGQTINDLAGDILITKKWANMVSCGPFISCSSTPLAKYANGNPDINLKMIAIFRLLMPNARIPVTTALETLLGEEGRKKALMAGANSLMFNLTPKKYRPLYKIYPGKFYKKEEMWEKYGLFKYEESYRMLEERMSKEILS